MFGCEHQIAFAAFGHGKERRDLFAGIELQNIDDRAPAGVPGRLGNFIPFDDVNLAEVGEEHKVVVGGRREDAFHKVFVFRLVRGDAHAAPVLALVFRNGLTFDVSAVSHRNDDVFLFDKVFDIDFGIIVGNFAATRRIVRFLDLQKFFLDDVVDFVDVGKNFLVVGDFDFFLSKFVVDLFDFQRSKSAKSHFKDCRRLFVAEKEPFHKGFRGGVVVGAFFDDLNDLVDVRKRDCKTF